MKKFYRPEKVKEHFDYFTRAVLNSRIDDFKKSIAMNLAHKFDYEFIIEKDESIELNLQSECNKDCIIKEINLRKGEFNPTALFIDESENKEYIKLDELCIADLINVAYALITIQEKDETNDRQN